MSAGNFAGGRPNQTPPPAQPAAGAPAAGAASGGPVNRPATGGFAGPPRTSGSSAGNSSGGAPFNRPGNRGPHQRNNSRYADQTRVNERIRAPKVRVVDGITNQQYGVLPTQQALRMAKERGLDLVEVASSADPPVCKIVDYGKYKYIQEKHKKEAHKHQKGGKLKELKFRIGIDPHDYLIKIVHAEDFLAEGHKVRIQLQFRGRQMAHQELGHQLAAKIKTDLSTMGHADQEPKMAGRNINMQMSPLPERQRHRKFKTHLKGVTDQKDMLHQGDHDPREDKHDEHDEHEEHHHDDHQEKQPTAEN